MTRIATLLSTTALAATAGAWMAWAPLAGAQAEPPQPVAEAEAPNPVADLVERTSPAVVTVLASQDDEMPEMGLEGSPFGPDSPFEEFFRRWREYDVPDTWPESRPGGVGILASDSIARGVFYKPQTTITTIDLTDRAAPAVLHETTLDGSLVDSRAAALVEAGDILLPMREGAFGDDHIAGELGALVSGRAQGRMRDDDVTVFKSLGMAVEDVVAARLAFDRARALRLGREVTLA